MKQSLFRTQLASLLLLLLLPNISVAHDFEVNGIYYNIDGDNAVVTYKGTSYYNTDDYSDEVSIPSSVTHDGTTYSVTSIGSSAFYNCTGLTSITIPNSVISIGGHAFSGCIGLTEITIPNSVTTIGYGAFSGCKGLKTVYFNAENCSDIDYEYGNGLVFRNCPIERIVIGDNVAKIPANFAYGLTGLTEITIPNSVTSIGGHAFYGCTGLTEITIPNSVTTIGQYAFSNCTGLKTIYFNAENCSYYYSSYHPFRNCPIERIVIGDNVAKIPANFANGLTGLTEITIPNSVTSIGSSAFSGCTGLTNITIPNSVTSIDGSTFSGCTGLTGITIPNSVTSIGSSAFSGCTGLAEITIPNSVTSVGSSAFSGCTGLTNITIPNSVTTIGYGAFSGCTGLTSATIGNSVASIGRYVFNNCTGLKTVYFNAENCNDFDISYASYHPFYDCPIERIVIGVNVKNIPAHFARWLTDLTEISIPNSITSIGSYAFSGCTGLTNINIQNSIIGGNMFSGCTGLTSITIPNSVTTIGYGAFSGCTELANVNIQNSIIGQNMFSGCKGLTEITIPNSVTEINGSAFSGCTGLTEINIQNSIIGSSMFSGCTGLTEITIPNSVTSIGNGAFSGCTGLKTVYFNAENCGDFSSSGHPFSICSIERIVIGDNVKKIPSYFANVLTGLTEITIPNSVTSIGYYAFQGCTGLTNITIPNSVTSIGNGAFSGCTGLKTVYFNAENCIFSSSVHPFSNSPVERIVIGANVKKIPGYFAYKLTGLTEITIPNSVTSVGNNAFYNCTGLTSITIPNSVTSVGNSAFRDCSGLKTVYFNAENCSQFNNSSSYHPFSNCPIERIVIGANVKRIPAYFADALTGLTEITIPNSVTSVGANAFSGCTGLTNINIQNSIIGSYMFQGCTGLTEITIPNAVTSIDENAFSGCRGLKTVYFNAENCGDFSSSGHPFSICSIERIVIGDNVKKIPGYFAYKLTGLTEITIPNSVTSIGNYAFSGCTGLTEITIPNSVTSIGNGAFQNCTGLTSITIGEAVTSIGNYAFYKCTGLTSITIGEAVTSIGNSAFYNCSGLESVICWALEPPSLVYNAFNGVLSSMCVYVPSIAVEAYQSASGWNQFEILPINDGHVLSVSLPENVNVQDYANMRLELTNAEGGDAQHYTLTDKSSYKFTVEPNSTWNVTLTNQYGDLFGKIEHVEVSEENVAVIFPSLLKPQDVSLKVKKPNGQDVTAQCKISWFDEDGELLLQGNPIKKLPAGRKLKYQVSLPQDLATAYTLPSTSTYTVKDGNNEISCQLSAIGETLLSGKVKDATNNQSLYGSMISAVQSFGGGTTKIITATTDNQGQYSLDASTVPTTLTIAATGYISQTIDCDMTSGGSTVTVPDVALSPITGAVVNINLTYTPAHAEGESAETQNWYSDYNNVDYEVYNMTTGHAITDISVQYPQIVLLEDVNDGNVLELTATSRKNAFKPVKTTVTIAEQKATATFNIKELGKVTATFNRNINPKVTGTLYDAENKLVKTADYSGSTQTIEELPDGNYQLVTMGKSDFFNSIYDLDQFASAGLTEGDDYVKNDVQVNSGIISLVSIDEVPFFDESKFYYTGEHTSFSVNKPSIVVGNYLTYRAQIDFKEQYANQVSDVQLIVDLPESCSFIDNSVMAGAALAGYSTSGNRITIPMANYSDIVRFCAIPTMSGDFAPSAFVRFKLNGKYITQPIGNAPFTAQGLSITVPTTVAKTLIPISGTAIGACEVDIYDNDVLIGHTTSLQNGTWSTQCELYNPYNLSTHRIYAKVTTAQGYVLQTEVAKCFYDQNAIEVDNVVMTFYNGWLKHSVTVTFDFLNGTVNPSSYSPYTTTTDITFVVNFTNNDTTTVSDVVVNVFTDHNNIHRLLAVYDENSNQWVASATFSSNDLPVNVSVDYSVNTEWIFTSTHLNDVLSEAKSEYDEYVQGRNDIDEMLANAWAAIEDAGDNTDALLAAYDSFDNVISQINAIYNLGIDLQSSSEYDYLSEEELEATEAEDITRMLTFLQELEQEIEFINKTYIYQEYSDYVDQQNGITISSTTCDGLSPAYLLVNGYEAIFTDNGDSIYVKFRSDTVSYVNFEENICQTIVLSDIGKSIMFASTVMELASSEESSELIEELKVIFNKIEEKQKQADQILAMLGRATVNSIKDDYTEMLANCNNLVGTFKELSNLVSDFVDKAKDTKLFTPLKSLQDKYNRLHNEWSLAKAHATKSKNINRHLFWKSIAARLEEQMPKSKFLMNSGKFLMRYAPVAASAFAVADGAEKIATVVGAASTIFPCENDVLNACRAMIYAIGIVRNIGNYVGANIAVDLALDGTTLATSETVLGAVGFIVLKYIASWGVDKATGWLFNSQMNTLYNKIGALKCQKELESEPSEPKTPPTTPIHDPSGFVYEGVPSNRLQGVTATCYYKETVEDMYGDLHEEVVLWDAEQYGQENPLLTDENGFYRWDVPVGMWQVKYEKEGYETTYSDWLPVPPPQLDVNIGMVQMRQPEVIKARAYPKAVEFEFDKFMFPETLNSDNITVTVNGSPVSGTIELLNAEVDDPLAITSIRRAPGTGLTFASKVRFNANIPFNADKVTLHVKKDVKSYADLEMYEDYEAVLDVELEIQSIEADSTVNILYGDSRQLTVTVLPANASRGKTLSVRSVAPMIATTDAESYTLNNNGQAIITVDGDVPGMTSLLYSIEGYDLTASTLVKVMMESQITVATPTASIASGSEVEKGTAVYLYCMTEGVTIYYTLDGSCPCDNTPARKVYDGTPIIINSTTTIKAMATAPDLYDSDVATFVYRVGNGLMGDVNGDGEVNIADVNAVIDIILGGNVDADTRDRADVNEDGEINIADINAVINIILDPSRLMSHKVNCNDKLHLENVNLRPGDVRTLQVNVDHASQYSAMQCDIVLPAGLTLLNTASIGNNVTKVNNLDETSSRALSYSPTKVPFASNSQGILTLTVRADEALEAESEIVLTNVVLADAENKAWHLADCKAQVNNTSGVNDLTSVADKVWVEGHTLFIEAHHDGTAQLATINGIVCDIPVKAGVNQHRLDQGIYIVVINGVSHKIAIK